MNRVDIARFEFDFDTTWAGFVTDSKLRIYSRYGGRDEHEPDARLSKASLLQTLRESLDAHKHAGERDAAKPATAPVPVEPLWHPEPNSSRTPLDIPLLRKSQQGCVHCHQVREYSLLQAYHDGRFNRELLFSYPLPESLGIEFDRSHGHRVARVQDKSPAAGHVKPGEVIVRCDEVPIRSEMDLRWALNRLPASQDRVKLRLNGGETLREVELVLPANWRQTELSWRKSARSVPADWGFRGAALAKFERREAGLPESGLAIRILSVKPRGFAQAFGLQKGDVIIALGDDSRERNLDRLRSDLLRRYSPGDELSFTIRRGDETLTLHGKFPAWFTEETTVP
jgi:predicted metalloprotease with PDZ domain